MDWRRKRQIRNLVDGILELNTLHRPPIELIPAIMKQRGIVLEERDEDDEEFCGVYMIVKQAKIIFVNANLRTSRKHFTIAHELGHHYLGHPLQNGAIICDSDSVFGKNKTVFLRNRKAALHQTYPAFSTSANAAAIHRQKDVMFLQRF